MFVQGRQLNVRFGGRARSVADAIEAQPTGRWSQTEREKEKGDFVYSTFAVRRRPFSAASHSPRRWNSDGPVLLLEKIQTAKDGPDLLWVLLVCFAALALVIVGLGACGIIGTSSAVQETKTAAPPKIQHTQGSIAGVYEIEPKTIGEGSGGSVSRGTHKSTKQVRAIKSIVKSRLANRAKFEQEITIMKSLDHPNLIALFETFEDHRNVYLVMELCTGGELFDWIVEAGQLTEQKAAFLMQQILRAVHYLHENGIMHRDLKPENFLLTSKEPIEKNCLKVIDLGVSAMFTSKAPERTSKVGTPYYIAPQVLAGRYDKAADLWSVGVIMYILLCGYPPFTGGTDTELLAKVRAGKVVFDPAEWGSISSEAKDLVRKLLEVDPRSRYTATQAIDHVWAEKKGPTAGGSRPLGSGLLVNLQSFRSANMLKRRALHVIARHLDEEAIGQLREAFIQLDKNGDGHLTVAEMKEGMTKFGLAAEIPPDLKQLMEEVDSNGSGTIEYTEFLAAAMDTKHHMQEYTCWTAFRLFDQNGDGKISEKELREILTTSSRNGIEDCMGAEAVVRVLEETDADQDGQIDFQEFMGMMRNCNGEDNDIKGKGDESQSRSFFSWLATSR